MGGTSEIPKILPVLPVNETVVFPFLIVSLQRNDERSIRLINEVLSGNKLIATFCPKRRGFLRLGTASVILKMFRFPDGNMRFFVQGLERVKIKRIIQSDPFIKAEVEIVKEKESKDIEMEAMMRNISSTFQKIVRLAPYLPEELESVVMNISSAGRLADFIASQLNIKAGEKQLILETLDTKERLSKLIPILAKELTILQVGEKIRSKVKTKMGKSQREYYLREQMQAIQKELGVKDEHTVEVEEFKKKIEEAKMPEEARKVAEKELARLRMIPSAAAEYTVSRTYLDWLTSLPWSKETEDVIDIKRARQILNEDHYDLKDVKERVLEYLAVRKLKKDIKGPILCFVGPPGVGKTSLGQSIARALGRKFVRFSLGGVRDEAEIRGHRRTYIGALPGRIIQRIKRAGTKNPVYMLDEVDKIGVDFRGDPASALLEVLDPEQNSTFTDHYLDVPFDLSKVIFITTANIVDPIPPALKDRMELIHLPGYILEEKVHIAKQFLIPKQMKENGLSSRYVELTDGATKKIIQDYTREAGVRNLERAIASCMRKIAKEVASGKKKKRTITARNISNWLGPPLFYSEVKERKGEIGVATALAWTADGGTILFIEATKMRGKKGLTLTGKLGDVMKESAQAALSYVRADAERFGIKDNFFDKYDIHIHVPEGAIPKDGPSAGVAIAAALVSLFTEKPVNPEIAMTGEITLRGKVLPVGGVREKVLAAKRVGIKKVILPDWNKRDLEKMPYYVKKGLEFQFIKRTEEAIRAAIE